MVTGATPGYRAACLRRVGSQRVRPGVARREAALRSGGRETPRMRKARRGEAVRHAQLAIEGAEGGFDGVFGDPEFLAYRLVREPAPESLEHGDLAGGQAAGQDVIELPGGFDAGDDRPLVDLTQRGRDVRGVDRFEDEGRGAAGESGADVMRRGGRGESDQLDVGVLAMDDVQPVAVGPVHVEVQRHDVRPAALD